MACGRGAPRSEEADLVARIADLQRTLFITLHHLLDTIFDLPSLEGVAEVVITKQVVEGTAPPLHIYPDRSDRTSDASA